MLGIETKLLTLFYPQTDKQIEHMNQELEQYLQFFVDYRQKDWPDVVATTRRNGTHDMLTSAKLSVGYLVVGIIRELNKELSLHCSSIYINYMWSVLQQY